MGTRAREGPQPMEGFAAGGAGGCAATDASAALKDRRIARWLTVVARIAHRGHIRPNHLTLANLLLSAVAAACLAKGAGHASPWERGWAPAPVSWWPVVTFVVMGAAFVADLMDGLVARVTGRATVFGAVLDSTLDRYSDLFVAAGCAAHFAWKGHVTLAALSVLSAAHAVVIAYAKARTENFAKTGQAGFWQRGERCLILTIGVIAGHVPAALWLLATLPAATVGLRLRLARTVLASSDDPTGPDRGQAGLRGWFQRGTPGYRLALVACVAWVVAGPWLWPALYGAADPVRTWLERTG